MTYGISLAEVAEAANKSQQWISKVELGEVPCGVQTRREILRAFLIIMESRRKRLLMMDRSFQTLKNIFGERGDDWNNP